MEEDNDDDDDNDEIVLYGSIPFSITFFHRNVVH
jgi:hypothetical protein